MKTINLTRKFAVFLAALILASAVLGSVVTQMYYPQIGTIKGQGPEDPLEAWSESSVIIWQYNTTFYAARNMSTNMVFDLVSNLTRLEQNVLGNMTTGLLYLIEVQHNASLTLDNKIIVIESYNGTLRSWSNQGKGFLLSRLAADPDTSGWGDAEAPFWWYNTVQDTIKYWNGTGVVILPSIGGGSGLSYTLPFTYTFYLVGSTYYAEKYDGTLSSSTTASTLIQSVVNAVTNARFFFAKATYNIAAMIDVGAGKNLVFEGEDWEDTIFLDARTTGATRIITSTATKTPTGNLTVRNIKFDKTAGGDYVGKGAIKGSWNTLGVEHCKFFGNTTVADYSGGTAEYHHVTSAVIGAYATDLIERFTFINNYVKDFQYGAVSPDSSYVFQSGNYIENAQTWALGAYAEITNAIFTVSHNTLVDCAWYDEGIAFDSQTQPSGIPCEINGLIEDNNIYNSVAKPLGKGINVVTCNGVKISGNNIDNKGSEDVIYGGTIQADGGSYCALSEIVITDNFIRTFGHAGIRGIELANATIAGNQIWYGDPSGETYGIRTSLTMNITYGSIVMKGNEIRLNGTATTTRRGFQITRTAGSGQLDVLVEDNTISAYIGIYTSIASATNTVRIGRNSYNVTTKLSNGGAALAGFLENWISSANTTATTFVFNHALFTTPIFVLCSFNFTGWTSWTWSATTTQVTVTITGTLPASMTCYCQAKCDV